MDSKTAKRERFITDRVQPHRGKIRSLIGGLVDDLSEVDDVYQDVVEEAIEAFDVGQVIESLGSWLAKVARNKVLDRFRRRKTITDHAASLIEEEPSEEEAMERAWLRQEIGAALDELPAEQKQVFVMHELEGKTFEEIAQETGVNINTLLSRKRQALIALRENLKEVYDEYET